MLMCALSGHTVVISKAVLGRPHQRKSTSHTRLVICHYNPWEEGRLADQLALNMVQIISSNINLGSTVRDSENGIN